MRLSPRIWRSYVSNGWFNHKLVMQVDLKTSKGACTKNINNYLFPLVAMVLGKGKSSMWGGRLQDFFVTFNHDRYWQLWFPIWLAHISPIGCLKKNTIVQHGFGSPSSAGNQFFGIQVWKFFCGTALGFFSVALFSKIYRKKNNRLWFATPWKKTECINEDNMTHRNSPTKKTCFSWYRLFKRDPYNGLL